MLDARVRLARYKLNPLDLHGHVGMGVHPQYHPMIDDTAAKTPLPAHVDAEARPDIRERNP